MQADWQESALGGGLLVVFLLTVGSIPFGVAVLKGTLWAAVAAAFVIALLNFIDRNGSGLRGQVLRPGRVAVIFSVVAGAGVRMLLN